MTTYIHSTIDLTLEDRVIVCDDKWSSDIFHKALIRDGHVFEGFAYMESDDTYTYFYHYRGIIQ